MISLKYTGDKKLTPEARAWLRDAERKINPPAFVSFEMERQLITTGSVSVYLANGGDINEMNVVKDSLGC